MKSPCPNCRKEKRGDVDYKTVFVYRTNHMPEVGMTERYKFCERCGHRWVTIEKHDRDVAPKEVKAG